MSQVFQSLSLARSGSAFLSIFLNLNPSAICLHDPAIHHPNDFRLFILELRRKYQYVGCCDTMAGRYPQFRLPDAKTVYIARDLYESHDATVKASGLEIDFGYWREIEQANLEWAVSTHALVVSFRDLFELHTLRTIWNHVFEEGAFPAEKAKEVVRMNIQRHNRTEAFCPTPELLKAIA